ncbi:hypothetical protein RISK_002730 [Rhodopirellula islandica]|uniref:Uncharacterized protein n=1 Tax=Rhodopirellula islandica TaxID=595434 RepID=A0A0J1EI84_RHOIS|nr:hypothetical protein RISK_002730 [Rhodopirellula islandica]
MTPTTLDPASINRQRQSRQVGTTEPKRMRSSCYRHPLGENDQEWGRPEVLPPT